MTSRGWIGVDLDGTLARYTTWVHPTHIGEPIAPMVERVKQWLREDLEVRIFTARAYEAPPAVIYAIEQWCRAHLGQVLEVTCQKDLGMIELWDDRAVQVEPNTGEPTTYWRSRLG